MQVSSDSANFGQQVHQLKASRAEEGATGPLGKDVSAMAHARNEERKAEKNASDVTPPADQVELGITDSTNIDAAVSTIVTHNINESLQAMNDTSSSISMRLASDDESLSDLIRTEFSSLLATYRQQNPEQTEEGSLDSFTQLMLEGTEQGFIEAKETLNTGSAWDEETENQFSATKEQINGLISQLASAASTNVGSN